MKKGNWILGAIVVMTLGWYVSRDRPDPKLAFDRFWIDHQAANRDEKFEALFINGARPWGAYNTRTWFRGQWEAFHYHVVPRKDGTLNITYPATDEREQVVVSARKCNEHGFDYCLEISGNSRGSHRYFSKKDWRVNDGDVESLEERVRAEMVPATRE